jgi:pimeloyl-ACP methyl ester carboxylesterase
MVTAVAFAHATGFCGGVWNPVVAALRPERRVIVWDFPGHGSGPKLRHPIDWWAFGDWTMSQLAGVSHPLVGVGHSMGGAALLMAEIKAPGTFTELLLIEPIVPPPPFVRSDGPMSERALKRKSRFVSREEARANFAAKLPFSAWDSAAFEGYLACGLIDMPRATELACEPADEAEIYRTATQHGVWDLLDKVEVPTTILAGSWSDTHQPDFVRALATHISGCRVEIVPGTGHFLPMEVPLLVAKRIEQIAERLANEPGGEESGRHQDSEDQMEPGTSAEER